LIAQVSRFDPWKDPLGVIDVFRGVLQDFPDLQLALVGSMALDDPEEWEIYNNIMTKRGLTRESTYSQISLESATWK
jgi:trehalose synthase